MIFKWPTDKERIREYMRIPPKKKMQWLYQMREFMCKVSLSKKNTPNAKDLVN